jgi:orotate phosphoribosyltransferase
MPAAGKVGNPMPVSSARDRLRDIIREKSYITEGDFKLASGVSSNFFFDLKVTLLDPEGASLTADLILERLQGLNVTAIGGLVIGACPIASAVCVRSHAAGTPIQAFYVRKEPKKRGTQKMIEGAPLKKGDRVVMVEDVTTTGGSVMQAIQEVRGLGCEIVKLVTVVDREQGAREALAKEGLTLDALFTRRDFA